MAFWKRDGYDARFRDARPWLYGIATNLVGQHRREEARQFRLRQAAGPPLAQHDEAERAVVLLLIAWEQLSYEEVAPASAWSGTSRAARR